MIGKKVRFQRQSFLSNCVGIVIDEGATKGIYKVKVTSIEVDNGVMSSSSFLESFGLEHVIAFEEELELID